MSPSLLDTDILSEVLKAKDPEVLRHARVYREAHGPFAISVLSIVEIVQGFQRKQNITAVQKFLASLKFMRVIELDQGCAEIAGRIYGDLMRTGQPIGRSDPLIAATALHRNLTLVTGNTRHYERIAQLGYALVLDNRR